MIFGELGTIKVHVIYLLILGGLVTTQVRYMDKVGPLEVITIAQIIPFSIYVCIN